MIAVYPGVNLAGELLGTGVSLRVAREEPCRVERVKAPCGNTSVLAHAIDEHGRELCYTTTMWCGGTNDQNMHETPFVNGG
jgi:hypothetical protein